MDKYMQEIEKAVQTAAIDGTLTKEAVDMFHGILEENEELKDVVEKKDRFEQERNKTVERLERDLSMAHALNKVAAEAEMAMVEREQKMTTLELTAKHMEERVTDHKEMFTTVFRNSVLRKEVMTPVSAGSVDQYGTRQGDVYPAKDTVKEEET